MLPDPTPPLNRQLQARKDADSFLRVGAVNLPYELSLKPHTLNQFLAIFPCNTICCLFAYSHEQAYQVMNSYLFANLCRSRLLSIAGAQNPRGRLARLMQSLQDGASVGKLGENLGGCGQSAPIKHHQPQISMISVYQKMQRPPILTLFSTGERTLTESLH